MKLCIPKSFCLIMCISPSLNMILGTYKRINRYLQLIDGGLQQIPQVTCIIWKPIGQIEVRSCVLSLLSQHYAPHQDT